MAHRTAAMTGAQGPTEECLGIIVSGIDETSEVTQQEK